jgi:hypothetical protein
MALESTQLLREMSTRNLPCMHACVHVCVREGGGAVVVVAAAAQRRPLCTASCANCLNLPELYRPI